MQTKTRKLLSNGFSLIAFCVLFSRSDACTFTVTNNCPHPIWPGTLAGAGTPPLPTTGFRLDSGQSVRIPSTPGWSGRIWARTGCSFDESGIGICQTGDCGGRLECDGNGSTPPASLFEITVGAGDEKDYYDVSLVDGYNLPIVAVPQGVYGTCNATGCTSDINTGIPFALCPRTLPIWFRRRISSLLFSVKILFSSLFCIRQGQVFRRQLLPYEPTDAFVQERHFWQPSRFKFPCKSRALREILPNSYSSQFKWSEKNVLTGLAGKQGSENGKQITEHSFPKKHSKEAAPWLKHTLESIRTGMNG